MKRFMFFCVMAVVLGLAASALAAADGAAVYKAKCAPCHGPEAQGTPMAPGFKGNDFVKTSTDQQLMDIVLKGREGPAKRYKQFPMGMPKQNIKEDEAKAVVEHIKGVANKK
ncbi:MAG: cytochrome c [Deltaproteobacteria bacterium]|nr:cytochrome c [Deltaproteobacteria bacterium]